MRTSRDNGFTLIELLVVIAIIGILSAVVLASLNTARAGARDAKRLADMHSLQTALELYEIDNNGSYPSTGGVANWWGNCTTWGSHGTTGAAGWIPNLAPKYISVLPLDPNPIQPNSCYVYTSNGTDYMLLVYHTVETYTLTSNKWIRSSAPLEATFAFYSTGASGW
jgi:prepilin-type N-terminal cleavage/methylation domain-containing protein